MIHMDKYSETPSCKNLTSYPTIIDIVEMIAEQEEKSVESFSPLQSTPISEMIRNGFYTGIRGEKEGTTELEPTSKSGQTTYRGQNRFYETSRPSHYRDYNEGNELYSHLQISELKVLLDSHPVIASFIISSPNRSNPSQYPLRRSGTTLRYPYPTYGFYQRQMDCRFFCYNALGQQYL